ncbi:MBL fold metallo-hydrolase [Thermococcus sp.]
MIFRFDDLYLIDLPQKMEGFRHFIGSWVLKEDDRALLVDVGPANTVQLLDEALNELGIKRVEYVLLTHIHLDHAGGIGHLIELHPEAKVVVHERGAKHLTNPTKLWTASRKVLGDLALVYGKIKPVPDRNIYRGEIEFGGFNVEILPTPGHAPHHQSYLIGDYLFTGDSAGVFIEGEELYLRPSTPPKFVKELYMDSLEKMLQVGRKNICFAHFGMYGNSQEIIRKHRYQIELWVKVMRDAMESTRSMEEAVDTAWEELLEVDELLSAYFALGRDVQKRERKNARTSLIGIYRYLMVG